MSDTLTQHVLVVTLTGADTPCLRRRLPLRGLLHVAETGPDGSIVAATFRIEEHGEFYNPIVVENPRFTYGDLPMAAEPITAAEHYQRAAHNAAVASEVHRTQTALGQHQTDEDLSLSELFERHMRLAEVHAHLGQVRTAGAAFVANRPALGQRAGANVEYGAWDNELRNPVPPTLNDP